MGVAPRRSRITHRKMQWTWRDPWRDTVLVVILIFMTSSCSLACSDHGQEQNSATLMNLLTSTTLLSTTPTSTTPKPRAYTISSVAQQTSMVIAAAPCAHNNDALCSASNIVQQFVAPEAVVPSTTNSRTITPTTTPRTTTATIPAKSTTTRKFDRVFSKRRRSRIRTFAGSNSIPVPQQNEDEEEQQPMELQSFMSPVIVNLPRSSSGGPRFETQMAGNGLIPPPPYLLKRTRSIPQSGRSVSHTRRAIVRPQQPVRPMRTQGVEVPIPSEHKSQFNVLNAKEGTYRFGYDTGTSGEQSYRYERRQPDGKVVGKYGFLDPAGVLREVNYVADSQGFRPVLVNRYRVDMDFPSVIGPIPAPLKFA